MNQAATPRPGGFKVLAINFHYVHSDRDHYPGVNKLAPDQFRWQLDVLGDLAECVSPGRLEELLADGAAISLKPGFVLTFDDGLRDHIDHVAPELERRGWKAFFFVNSAQWEHEMMAVHRLQLLNGSVPFPKLYASFVESVRERLPAFDLESIPMDRVRAVYHYDGDDVARFKFAVHFELPIEIRETVLRHLFHSFLGPDEKHVQQLYRE